MKSKHRIQVKRCYEIAAEDDQPILKSSRIESYCKSKKESISEVIARLVFVDGLTFNQIANSSLISRAFKADGYFTLKNPQTIRDHFVKEFKTTLMTVCEKVSAAKKNGDRCFTVSPLSQSNSKNFSVTMGLFCAKSLFHQYSEIPSVPGVFLSGTRNPGFKILSRIGNTISKPTHSAAIAHTLTTHGWSNHK